MRSYFRINRADLIAFVPAALLYTALVVVWSNVLAWPDNTEYSLGFQKDLIYYGAWAAAALYALLGTLLSLKGPQRRLGNVVAAFMALAVPLGAAFGMELAGTWFVTPWINSLELAIDVVPAIQLVIAGAIMVLCGFFAVRYANLPGQPVIWTYIRLGMGLTFIPQIAFVVMMILHHDWRGPTRGVAVGNAVLLGIVWAAFFVWIVGSNLLEKPETAAAAKH